jgi:hypothetical protein
VSNKVIAVPVLLGYLGVFWGGVAGLSVWITSNKPPMAPEVKFKEANIFATTKIEVEIAKEAEDPDGDLVTYMYGWTRNGAEVEAKDGRVIPDKELNAGEVWEVTVTPNDGTIGACYALFGVEIMPWRQCAEIGKNAAKLAVTVKDSPPRARIRFINDEGREVTQLPGGKNVVTRLSCMDPDLERAKQRRAEAAAAKGETVTPEPPKPDICSYEYRWVNIDVPEPEGTPPRFAGVYPPESGAPTNPDGTPKPPEIQLPAGVTKSGEVWKLVVTAAADGVKGDVFEAKLKIL